MMRHAVVVGCFGVLLMAASAQAQQRPGGWIEHPTAGDTLCARGAPYSFFVKPGTTANVIVDFVGGGACWNAESCADGSPTFTDTIDWMRDMTTSGLAGVYDATNATNPYRNWTHVLVPYCTGDVHWGARDATYTRTDGTSYKIYHRGAANTKAVLDFVKTTYPDAAKVFVTGCSAGAYGAVYWTPRVRQDFPRAEVREFGDSGAGVDTAAFRRDGYPQWNVTANAPAWIPALDPAHNDWSAMELTDFYERAGAYYPDVPFAQYNSIHDFIQTLFYQRMGGTDADWSPKMVASIDRLETQMPHFRGYIGPGETHCATVDDGFYDMTSGGVKIRDWLDSYMNGAVPASVH